MEDADGVPVTVGVDRGHVTVTSPGARLDGPLLEWMDRAVARAEQEAKEWRAEHGHDDAACPHGPGWHERAVGCEDGTVFAHDHATDREADNCPLCFPPLCFPDGRDG